MSEEKHYYSLERMGITKIQRQNLELLYARTEQLLEDPKFSMSSYSEISFPFDEEAEHCGTVACFAGHGPKVGIRARTSETWQDYVDRVFGEPQEFWTWLFDAGWTHTDDTLGGARKRLRIALDRGVPEDYWEQMMGRKPLEYDDYPEDDESAS